MTIQWLSSTADIDAIEAPWRDLEASVQHRTHVSTFDFLATWYRHYAGDYGGRPLVGIARDGTRLSALAPLTIRRGSLGRMPVTRVDFAPSDSIAGEFLVRDERPDILAEFLTSLRRHVAFDVVCLNGFESDSRQLHLLTDAARDERLPVHTEDHAYAVVDLRDGYERYRARINGNIRRKLNSRARQIETLGATVDGVFPAASGQELDTRIERMIAITEASHKLQGQRLAEHHRHFLADLVRRTAARGTLSLPILSIGGRDAAFILGVLERGCVYDVTLSYDESFARLGPGIYLMHETLRQLAEAGVHTFLSHGAHEYKRQWATTFVPQKRMFLFATHPRAAAARLVRFGLQPLWRRLGMQPALGDATCATP